jgi:hypothetical protein
VTSETSLDEEAIGTAGRDDCRFRACALGLWKDQPPLVRISLLLLLVIAWTRGAGFHGLLYGSHRGLKCVVRLSDVSVDMDETVLGRSGTAAMLDGLLVLRTGMVGLHR